MLIKSSLTKGILLSGGNGKRLRPLTYSINKHILSVDGKFIIDYPIQTLKNMGCTDVTIILGGDHFSQVVDHLKDGSDYGMKFNYVYQPKPSGIAEAINLCKDFVFDQGQFAVCLGDNIFSGPIVWDDSKFGAQIVLYNHPKLENFGVASFDGYSNSYIEKIQEKPKQLDPNIKHLAVTGCYLFTKKYFDYFKMIKPSARGELEITDIINIYLKNNNLHHTEIKEFWSDAGTHESIKACNQYFYNKQ